MGTQKLRLGIDNFGEKLFDRVIRVGQGSAALRRW
jgi:hypothetical protein